MAGIPPSRFRRQFRILGQQRQLRFLADLWEHRGFETEIVDDTVIASTPSDRFRIAVGNRSQLDVPNVDVIVLTDERELVGNDRKRSETRWITIDDLRKLLHYAIDRKAGDELARRYFDRPIEIGPESRSARNRVRSPYIVNLVAVIVLVFLVAMTLGLVGGPGPTVSDGSGLNAGSTDGDDFQASFLEATEDPRSDTDIEESDRHPAGLSEDGEIDIPVHIAAHLNQANASAMGGSVTIEGPAKPKRFEGDMYITPAGEGNWIWGLYRMALESDTKVIDQIHRSDDAVIVTSFGGQHREEIIAVFPRSIGAIDDRTFRDADVTYRISASRNPDPYHFEIDRIELVAFVSPDGEIVNFIIKLEYPHEDERVTIEFVGD